MSESDGKCGKCMYIILRIKPNRIVPSMTLVIHQINARSWGDLVLSIIKIRPNKDHRHNTENRNKFNRQQENNNIVNHAVDEIIPQELNKVSAEEEAHVFCATTG